MRISLTQFIAGLFFAVPGVAIASTCSLGSLTVVASKDGEAPVQIITDLTMGTAEFFEGRPYSYTSGATIGSDGQGLILSQRKSTTTIDVGFKGKAFCYGNKVLVDFSHTDLIGVQTVEMALTNEPSYPPLFDELKTTLVVAGGTDAVPETRTMNGWLYTFRAK